MFPNVPLYPGPSRSLWAMCTIPKVLNQEGRRTEGRLDVGRGCISQMMEPQACIRGQVRTDRTKHGFRRSR